MKILEFFKQFGFNKNFNASKRQLDIIGVEVSKSSNKARSFKKGTIDLKNQSVFVSGGTGGSGEHKVNRLVPISEPMDNPVSKPIEKEDRDIKGLELLELKEYRKEICKHCRGKGYATYQYGTWASADFPGDYSGITKPVQIHIQFCVCSRGKQLERVMTVVKQETELDLTKRFYTSLKRRGAKTINYENMRKMFEGYWKEVLKVYKPLERG